jgi:type II secretory pathway pseudopilin PulG
MTTQRINRGTQRVALAFSLSEMLIALGVMGLIALFAVPKVLQRGAGNAHKAALKQTLSQLEAVAREAAAEGTLNTTGQSVYTLIMSALPLTSSCTNAVAGSCWSSAAQADADFQQGGLITPTGLQVAGLSTTVVAETFDGVVLDANGPKGENSDGTDILKLGVCVAYAGCSASAPTGYPAKRGDVFPLSGAANLALYDSLKR